MRQIEVQIMGVAYLLGVPEHGELRLHAAVKRVDTAMCRIRDAGKIKARDRIAVLAALNLAFELADREAGPLFLQKARVHAMPLPAGSNESAAATARLAALSQQLEAVLQQQDDHPAPTLSDSPQAL